MKTFIFGHRVIETRTGLVSAESTKAPLPDEKYWKFLGFVEIENQFLKDKLNDATELLEVDEDMYTLVPEINQLFFK